jgi:hypothetical protein
MFSFILELSNKSGKAAACWAHDPEVIDSNFIFVILHLLVLTRFL